MTEKQTITLQGLNIAVHMPTESRLTYEVTGLSPNLFAKAAKEIEDWFTVVDSKYTKRKRKTTDQNSDEVFGSGRGWKGRGHKINKLDRTRAIGLSPFPSRFSNVLRTIRREIYIELNQRCSVIAGSQYGKYKHNIYILPYSNSIPFSAFVAAKNKELKHLNEDITEYQKTRDYQDIKDLLKKYHVEMPDYWNIEGISLDITPLALNTSTLKNVIDKEYKRVFEDAANQKREMSESLKREYEEGKALLQENLEKQEKEVVQKAFADLQGRINEIVGRMIATRIKPKKVKTDLEAVKRIAEGIGLGSIAASVVDPLIRVAEDPDAAKTEFGENLLAGVDDRIKGLLKGMQ